MQTFNYVFETFSSHVKEVLAGIEIHTISDLQHYFWFTGAVRDRKILREYFCGAGLSFEDIGTILDGIDLVEELRIEQVLLKIRNSQPLPISQYLQQEALVPAGK